MTATMPTRDQIAEAIAEALYRRFDSGGKNDWATDTHPAVAVYRDKGRAAADAVVALMQHQPEENL